MGDLRRLPRRQVVLVDERGVGLRATWHPERELVVVSIWHGDTCAASFRLGIADAPRLGAFLDAVMQDWAADVLATRPATPNGDQHADDNGGG